MKKKLTLIATGLLVVAAMACDACRHQDPAEPLPDHTTTQTTSSASPTETTATQTTTATTSAAPSETAAPQTTTATPAPAASSGSAPKTETKKP